MKIFLNILGVLIILIVLLSMVAAIGGSFMDSDHQVSLTAHINASPDSVFKVINDFRNYPEWRKELLKVEMLPKRDSISVWREYDKWNNNWAYEASEVDSPSYVRIQIAEPEMSVQGSWAISIIPDGNGSQVNVIEEGSVENVFFRFIGRVCYRQTATIEAYLTSLAGRFGQKLSFDG